MAIEDPNQTGIQTINPDSLDTGAALGRANAQSMFQTPLNTDSLDTGAALGQANASEMVSNFRQSFNPSQAFGYLSDAYGYATPTAPQEPQAYQGPIEYQRPDGSKFYSYDGRVLPVPVELSPDFDPYSFDYLGETDLSYRFMQPEIPSGIEAIYAPTERDPFRADWMDAEFRDIIGYEGELLEPELMNVIQDAELFLISLNQEAASQGFSSTEDFLRSLEINDPNYFAALSNKVNESASLMGEFGDRYRFQTSLYQAQQIPTEFRSESERIQMGMDTLRDLVSLGVYTPEEAAFLASNPAGLLSLLNQEDPAVTTPTTDTTTDTTTETTTDADADAETGTTTTTDTTDNQGISNVGELDSQGRQIQYASWDENKEYPFVFDASVNQFVPALDENQRITLDNNGMDVIVTTDPNTQTVSDITPLNEYPDFFSGDMSGASLGAQQGAEFGRTIDESLIAPVNNQGVYDLGEDYSRSPENVLSMYFSDGDYGLSTSDLMDELTTGFSRTPVFDMNKFKPVSESEFNLAPADERVAVTRRGEPRTVRGATGYRTVYDQITDYYVSVVPKSDLEYESAGLFDASGENFLNEHVNNIFFDLTGYEENKNQQSERVFTRAPGFRQFYDDVDVQSFMLQEINDYLSQTGKSLRSVAFQEKEDIGSGSDSPDIFDVQSFVFGNEGEGWDGIFDKMKTEFDTELSNYTSEEFDTMYNLSRFALMTAGLAHPIFSRIDDEYNSRLEGNDFGGLSIASSYIDEFGNPPLPDYLDTALNLAQGGYIGGIAGGMDDTIPATVDGSNPAALSSGEFVIPADVVSHLGDGNNQNGAQKLYGFLDDVRMSKTGSIEQPAPINDGIFASAMGEDYGF